MNDLKEETQSMQTQTKKKSYLVREVIETVVLTALLFLAINLAVQNYDVDGPSMEPSLHNQERIMVDKVSYLFHSPDRGDVVVFKAPPSPSEDYVKRIIAVPGDTITIIGTTVKVNGTTLNETYVDPADQGNGYAPIVNRVVPAGDYFVMGDDRVDSYDSRAWGFVPRANIIGRAALVYWPLNEDNSGFLPNVSSVFSHIHQNGGKTLSPLHVSTFGIATFPVGAAAFTFLLCSKGRKKRR